MILSFLIILNLPRLLIPGEPDLRFIHLTIGDGLSQNTANCVLQDVRGFMWIGTQDGLNRYDGYEFKIFRHMPLNPTSISDSYILSIFEDQAGVIWIGTYGGGLNRFDREKEKFTHYRVDPVDPNSLTSNHVLAIFESPLNPGVLWIGTDGGLSKLSQKNERFTNYRHNPQNPNSLSHNIVHAVFSSPKNPGVLWVGTNGGLNKFDIEKEQFSNYCHNPNDLHSLSHDIVWSIYEDRSGNLWIGTNGGLNAFDHKRETFIRFKNEPDNPNSLSNNNVRTIYESPIEPGILWIGTYDGGLNRFDPKKKTFSQWKHEPGNPFSINNDKVLSLYEDKSGTVWIGCEGGINLFDRHKKQFSHYRRSSNNPNTLGNNDVRSICESQAGILWIGTYGGGVSRLDRKKDRFVHYRHDPHNPNSLSSNLVRVVYEDRDGVLWVGTYDGGLNKFDPEKGQFVHYKSSANDPYSVGSNYIRTIFEDRSGVLWIGTYEGGLNRFHRKKDRFTRYVHRPDNPSSLSNNRVFAIFEDKSGVLWVGTAGGLNKFNREQGEFSRYQNRPYDLHSLGSNVVMSIYEDRSGTLWIGTYGGGLNRFNRLPRRFTRLTEEEGLANNVVYGILEDDERNLWLSTNKGLSRFNPKTMTFKNYDTADGLQDNEFNAGAYCKTSSGEMFFGGINGFNAFFPDKIKDNSYIPPIVVTNFHIFNKPVPIGDDTEGHSILTRSISETRIINLSHKENFLYFEYSALHYVFPEKNQYAYMMEGLDKDWNYVKNRRFASYPALLPGDYIFKVKGSNNDGVWNETGVSLRIRVVPSFWKSRSFYRLSVFAIIFLAVSLYRLRVRQLKKHKDELENLVNHRTEQLKNANIELEKLSIVAQKTDNGVMIMDAKGNFEWVNEGFTHLFGITLGELISEKGRNLSDVSENPNIKTALDTCIKERKTVAYETLNETRSGGEIWTQTTLTPILDQDGNLTKLVAIESDITRVKKSEEQIKSQNEEILKQSQELKRAYEVARKEREAADAANRSKSMFLARMSHEIRTPLNGVIGFSDLLLETELNEEQAEYARTITRSGEALLALINDILDISKIEAGKLTLEKADFDVEVMAFDVCNMILPRLEDKNVEVLCRIGDNVPGYMNSDPGRIRQVLVNLMSNAVKFTEQGEIELSVDIEEEGDNQLKLHVRVRDTGPGIPEDQRETIFELFHQADGTTRQKYAGTGLGLSICKQIARLMNGDVWVEGAPDKGSIFHFTAWVGKSKKRSGEKRAAKFLTGKRALIVDDNVTNLVILSQILKRAGMIPIELTKSKEVLPTILKSLEENNPIDLCILDIHMPGINGCEVAEQIRQYPDPRISNLPLLAFTSSAAKHAKQYHESGFDGFLPKPIQRQKLLSMIERLLGLREKETKQPVKHREIITRHTLAEEAKHSIHILLAEDNIINQKLAAYILINGGYHVDVVENGRQVIEKFTTEPDKYDLILMDIDMPEMDGNEATRLLRKKGFVDVPIIAMTAYAMKEDQKECLKVGMNDYIAKPIKRDIVYQMVNKWILKNPKTKKTKAIDS